MRHVLHRFWIGAWFSSLAGGIRLRGKSNNVKEHAKLSAKDAALVYHKLHQLSLTGLFLSESSFVISCGHVGHFYRGTARNCVLVGVTDISQGKFPMVNFHGCVKKIRQSAHDI